MNLFLIAQQTATKAVQAVTQSDVISETPLKEAAAVIEKAEVGFPTKEFYGNSGIRVSRLILRFSRSWRPVSVSTSAPSWANAQI